MRRGTTPTVTVTVGADLTGMTVYLALRQSGKQLVVKTGDELDVTVEDGTTTVECPLTQEDTLALSPGKCDVQIRATADGGAIALATTIGTIDVGRILQDGVLG